MKIAGRKFINIRKIVENLGNDVAANLEFMQLQGLTQLLFYKFLGKLKFFKKCFNVKVKLRLPNGIGVSCKISKTGVKGIEKFIQTVRDSGKEEKASN